LLPERKDSSGCGNLFSGRGRERKKESRVSHPSCLKFSIRHPHHPSFPKFSRESMFLNNLDPGLKIAGVTRRWESKCFETRGPLIETFRGDDTEAFSSGLFFVFFLCLFVFSSFPGVMRGLAPSLSVPSCLKFRRESSPSVIPEIFNRESKFLLFLFVFMFSSFQGVIRGAAPPL